jgi:hypothetical protein
VLYCCACACRSVERCVFALLVTSVSLLGRPRFGHAEEVAQALVRCRCAISPHVRARRYVLQGAQLFAYEQQPENGERWRTH